MNESMNDEGVCRTAPATPGLLKSQYQHIAVLFQICSLSAGSSLAWHFPYVIELI